MRRLTWGSKPSDLLYVAATAALYPLIAWLISGGVPMPFYPLYIALLLVFIPLHFRRT